MLFMVQLGKTAGILLNDCNFIFKHINCELSTLCNQSNLINISYLLITAEQDWESAHQLQWMNERNFFDCVLLTGCYVCHYIYTSVVGQLIILRIFKV